MEGRQPLLAGRLAEVHVLGQRSARVGHDKLDKGGRVVDVEEKAVVAYITPPVWGACAVSAFRLVPDHSPTALLQQDQRRWYWEDGA